MSTNTLKKREIVTDEAKVTGCDGLPVLNWRRFWLVEKPPKTRHYPSPVTNRDSEPDVEAEPMQVLEASSTCEPPEPAPHHPSWRTPATWNPQHGLWMRCGGIVPTAATSAALARYYDAKHDLYLATHPPIDAGQLYHDHDATQVLEPGETSEDE